MNHSSEERNPTMSVVIPVYNDIRVGVAIESAAGQQFAGDVEIMIIDGGSNEETMQVLDSYKDVLSVVVSEPDDGVFDALNKGVRLATGDVVALMGADDRFDSPRVFAKVMDVLKNPEFDGCYGDLVYVDDDDNVVRYWHSGRYHRFKLHFGWIVPHFTLFLRKSAYDKYGLLNTQYRYAADYEFFLRLLLAHNVKLAYIEDILLRMTLGGQSNRSFQNIVLGNLDAFRAWRNNGFRFGFLVPFLKPARKLLQYVHRPRARRSRI
jgi:glycosyltransferase